MTRISVKMGRARWKQGSQIKQIDLKQTKKGRRCVLRGMQGGAITRSGVSQPEAETQEGGEASERGRKGNAKLRPQNHQGYSNHAASALHVRLPSEKMLFVPL
jgi:hypothetical protein